MADPRHESVDGLWANCEGMLANKFSIAGLVKCKTRRRIEREKDEIPSYARISEYRPRRKENLVQIGDNEHLRHV